MKKVWQKYEYHGKNSVDLLLVNRFVIERSMFYYF